MIDIRECWMPDGMPSALEGEAPFALVHADPNWSYNNRQEGAAEGHYSTSSDADVATILDAAWDYAADGSRLVCWCTFPKLAEWMAVHGSMRWKYVTGGAWVKCGRPGVGYHWRGDSEVLLVYKKGSPPRSRAALSNAHVSKRRDHSVKPSRWLAEVFKEWCPPDGSILDLYAGLGAASEAAEMVGRRCVGLEGDPNRAAQGRMRAADSASQSRMWGLR